VLLALATWLRRGAVIRRAAGTASRQRRSAAPTRRAQVDVATFTQWVNAFAQDQTELVDFYFERFREEFRAGGGRLGRDEARREPGRTPHALRWLATFPVSISV
jgi:hypothetical protein